MIDLHCHILPGLDDGSPDIATSLAMAEMAVADGIVTTACTPHILPGVYANNTKSIAAAVAVLAKALTKAAIPLELAIGADVHVNPSIAAHVHAGRVPTLAGSRYLLLEPPHDVLPPRFEAFTFGLAAAGIAPILTHPERLRWIDGHYDLIQRLATGGVLMQVTAGSIRGNFGRRARYWAERMLDERLVDLLATDAHDANRRPPRLSEARELVAARCGEDTATALVAGNPLNILKNSVPSQIRPSSALTGGMGRPPNGLVMPF